MQTRENAKDELLSLKEQALEATKRKDGEFYRHYLADDAVAVVPFGVFDKEAIIKMMSGDSPFRSLEVSDTQVIELTPETGIVTYRASFKTGGDAQSTVFVTTVYAKIKGEWKGVFYQQTALQQGQPPTQ